MKLPHSTKKQKTWTILPIFNPPSSSLKPEGGFKAAVRPQEAENASVKHDQE
jgi:hypothetical protein